MKRYLRSLTFIAAVGFMSFAAAPPTGRADKPVFDPACLAICQQQHQDCFFAAATQGDQKQCLAEYRHCIAHCK